MEIISEASGGTHDKGTWVAITGRNKPKAENPKRTKTAKMPAPKSILLKLLDDSKGSRKTFSECF